VPRFCERSDKSRLSCPHQVDLWPQGNDPKPVVGAGPATGPPPCIRLPDTGPVTCLGHALSTVTWLQNSHGNSTEPLASEAGNGTAARLCGGHRSSGERTPSCFQSRPHRREAGGGRQSHRSPQNIITPAVEFASAVACCAPLGRSLIPPTISSARRNSTLRFSAHEKSLDNRAEVI